MLHTIPCEKLRTTISKSTYEMFKGYIERYNFQKITEYCKVLWSQTHHVDNYCSFHKSIWNIIIVAKHGRPYEFGILFASQMFLM